jgi:cytochrome c biogenesis protein CcmG, thiol:disulfide interchange protein DsbE
MRTPLAFLAVCMFSVAACGGETPDAKTPSTSSSSSGDSKTETKSSSGGGGGAGVKVGDKAPSLSLDSLNGGGKVAITPGKVTLVDFWATWCEPCKKSFPKYQDLYVKYKVSGLEIAAVSVDEEDAKKEIPGFAKNHGAVKFPVGWGGKPVAEQWKVENMPSAYIVDKNGVVRHIHRGYHDGEEAEIEKEIKALF